MLRAQTLACLLTGLALVHAPPLSAQEDGATDWSRPSAVRQGQPEASRGQRALPPPRIVIPGQGTVQTTVPAAARSPAARAPAPSTFPQPAPLPPTPPVVPLREETPPWEDAFPASWGPDLGFDDEPIDLWDIRHLRRLVPRTSVVLNIKKHHNQPWRGTWKALDLELTLLVVGQRGRQVGASVTFYDVETGRPLRAVLEPYVDGEGNVSVYTKTALVPDGFEILRTTLRMPYRALPPPRLQRGYEVEARVRLLRLEPDGRVTALARGGSTFLLQVDPHCPAPVTCADLRQRSLPAWQQAWEWDWEHLWTDDMGPIEDRMDNPHIRGDQQDDWYLRKQK